jgi:glycosyltransferase involved in cell wall biosynthesis
MPWWYWACDLVVLPSFSEGIPNVLREALSCGKPFVATNVGGIPEIAHPRFARLVGPGQPRELAEAIDAMLQTRVTADPGELCSQLISWDRSAQLVGECLEAIVARPLPVVNAS